MLQLFCNSFYSIFLSVIHVLKPAHVLFKLNPRTYKRGAWWLPTPFLMFFLGFFLNDKM